MKKKSFDAKLRDTVESQDKALQERFEKADAILIKPSKHFPEQKVKVSSVVREMFSMPPEDCALVESLRSAAAKEGRISSKSEIIRAALHVFSKLSGPELVMALNKLKKVSPGRNR